MTTKRIVLYALVALAVLAAGIGIGLTVGGGGSKGPDATSSSNVPPSGSTPGPGGSGMMSGQPTTSMGAPATPAMSGSSLITMSAPPQGTLAMIDATRLKSDAEYEIVFSPYGYGPPQNGSTLVIQITRAQAKTESAAAFDMSGRNMLVAVVPGVSAPASGGSYVAKLTFRAQGDLLLPVIGDIQAAK